MSDVETNLRPLLEDDEGEAEGPDTTGIITDLPPAHKGRHRRWLIAIVVVVILALVGGGLFAYLQLSGSSQPQYTQATVTSGNLSVSVSGSGPVSPHAQYNLDFPSNVSGQVSEIDVQVGQQVKAGQVLAKVNSPTLQDAVTTAQQALNNAQTAYNDAYNAGASQTVLDQDQGQVLAAQDQLNAAQHNLDATVLKAPAAGTIAEINGTVGQAPGASAASSSSSSTGSQPFILLVDQSSFTITAAVSEADIASVQVGQPASFTVAAYPNQNFHATVAAIDTVGQNTSNVVSYNVTLSVDQNSIKGAHIYPGMTATASITTAQRIDVLLVPNQAFTFTNQAVQAGALSRQALLQVYQNEGLGKGASATSNQKVVLELRNGKLTPVMVQTGLSNDSYTEIVSGLQEGDQVVVSATGGVFSASNSSSTTGTGLNAGNPSARFIQRGGGK